MEQRLRSPFVLTNAADFTDPKTARSSLRGSGLREQIQLQNQGLLSAKTSILPVLLPPATLRPVAFRTFTRKHNLTISSSALQLLATFVGKNCGSGWREEGLAELVLDEVAKSWKKSGGSFIVEEGKGASLQSILKAIEGTMSGGRIAPGRTPSADGVASGRSPESGLLNLNHGSIRPSTPDPEDLDSSSPDLCLHIRNWVKVINVFNLPRLTYNTDKRYFQAASSKPTLLPSPSHKSAFLKERYTLVHQRLLRNESFQASLAAINAPSSLGSDQRYRLAPISNLLGRSGTSHLILGLLSVSPTGDPLLVDLTGSVALDLSHARSIPEAGTWFSPGMIVLIDGIYEGEEDAMGSTLGGNSGVGGTIGGQFVAVSICGPPCERREMSLGIDCKQTGDASAATGFGWVDFLGVGSERAKGPRMRKIQARCLQHAQVNERDSLRARIAIMSEVNLDNLKTLDALRSIFGLYNNLQSCERPFAFIVIGNFVRCAVINGSGQAGSVEYKEYFDALATVLSEFPSLLRDSTFVFVPGDNDPWQSAFSAGAASTIPRRAIPDLFTSRVKRVFAAANTGANISHSAAPAGEAIWTSNPSRLSLFGPVHDIMIFRDDISGRLRRTAVNKGDDSTYTSSDQAMDKGTSMDSVRDISADSRQDTPTDLTPAAIRHGRKLVKTILDQGTISPFPISQRPILWDYASSLQLYPLPTGLILADAEAAPFCITYEGCHVMNPGRLVPDGETACARWVEYDVPKNRGRVREQRYQ